MATKSPINPEIDKAIEHLMKQIKKTNEEGNPTMPPDAAVRIINTAISWEKVKNDIKEGEGFDPSDL